MIQNCEIVCKLVSSLEKVFPTCEPTNELIRCKIAKNERLNLQIAIKNLSNTLKQNVSIRVQGGLADFVSFRIVELVTTAYTAPKEQTDDYYLSNAPCLTPDILKPLGVFGVVLPIEQWRSVWVTIESENNLPIGEFETVFEIFNEKGECLSKVSCFIEVVDLVLQKSDLVVTNWMHYDCISQKHGVALFGDAFYKVFKNYLRAYLDAGNTMLLIPLFTPPLDTQVGCERQTAQLVKVRYVDNTYEFDFSDLKCFIEFVLAQGVEYLELSHLFTQWGGEHCPKIMAETNQGEKRIFGWETDSHGEEYTNFLSAFLSRRRSESSHS